MGRQKDLEDVMARLMGSKPAIVNLFGSSGEGKSTLGKEICQKWPGKHHIWVDLREVTEMKDVYFHILLALDTNKTIIAYDENPVIEQLRTLREEERGDVLLVLDNVDNFSGGDEEAEELRTDFMVFLGRLFSKKDSKEKARIKVSEVMEKGRNGKRKSRVSMKSRNTKNLKFWRKKFPWRFFKRPVELPQQQTLKWSNLLRCVRENLSF